VPQKTRLTQELIGKFLEILANNGGIVCDAAEDLNISRTALYKRRNSDAKFRKLWDKAVDLGVDVIEDEAKRRALDGTEEPVYYQGEIVGYIKKKSDYCIGIVLKAHRDRYREKHEISGPDGQPLAPSVVVYLPNNARGGAAKKKKDEERK
jgi:hypothetical protein